MVIVTLFIIAKIWKQSKCPSIDEWIKDERQDIHRHKGILLSHKIKEWNLAIGTNMDRHKEYCAKWSKSCCWKQILYDLTPTKVLEKPKGERENVLFHT